MDISESSDWGGGGGAGILCWKKISYPEFSWGGKIICIALFRSVFIMGFFYHARHGLDWSLRKHLVLCICYLWGKSFKFPENRLAVHIYCIFIFIIRFLGFSFVFGWVIKSDDVIYITWRKNWKKTKLIIINDLIANLHWPYWIWIVHVYVKLIGGNWRYFDMYRLYISYIL